MFEIKTFAMSLYFVKFIKNIFVFWSDIYQFFLKEIKLNFYFFEKIINSEITKIYFLISIHKAKFSFQIF